MLYKIKGGEITSVCDQFISSRIPWKK